MSLLIYSPRCKHSMEVIDYVNKHPQLKQLVNYHNINTQGIPPAYRNKITRVPTMLTKNVKILIVNEIKNRFDSKNLTLIFATTQKLRIQIGILLIYALFRKNI